LVWVAFLAVPVYWFVLYRTRFGVHLRAVGEDAVSASAAGIDARRVKTISILVSGVMCGLAGSQLAMAFLGSFTAGMTSGRGFIAVAALTFGLAKPVRTMIACVIFAAADAVADQMSIAGVNSGLALMTPYIITIAALTVAAIRISLLLRRRTRSALKRSALVPSDAAAVSRDKVATTV
ncbi:ABC transporter permease subunit, partial [Cryobacterium tepidiphilum]